MNTNKPTLIHVIAWMTLASGIVNIFFGIAALSTFIGFICAPFSILPIILGVYEIVYAAKLFGNPAQPIKPSTNIAVLEIASVLYLNIFSMVVGILALVFYNDNVIKDYFARINGTRTPAPASLPQPEVAPVIEEPLAAPVEESPTEDTPVKPKRPPRKTSTQ